MINQVLTTASRLAASKILILCKGQPCLASILSITGEYDASHRTYKSVSWYCYFYIRVNYYGTSYLLKVVRQSNVDGNNWHITAI